MTDADLSNRRRAARLEFQSDCGVEPRQPVWTMLADPVPGKTVNLTAHGVQIMMPEFPRIRCDHWRQHLDRGELISVNVHLVRGGDTLLLPGNVVWMQYEAETALEGTCSVGVLLSVLPADAAKKLEKILRETAS